MPYYGLPFCTANFISCLLRCLHGVFHSHCCTSATSSTFTPRQGLSFILLLCILLPYSNQPWGVGSHGKPSLCLLTEGWQSCKDSTERPSSPWTGCTSPVMLVRHYPLAFCQPPSPRVGRKPFALVKGQGQTHSHSALYGPGISVSLLQVSMLLLQW